MRNIPQRGYYVLSNTATRYGSFIEIYMYVVLIAFTKS